MPSSAKVIFLFLPWIFVAYGVVILQDFVGFYNNSVETTGRVVFHEGSNERLNEDDARLLLEYGSSWPLPAFLYQHENGMFYVGQPMVDTRTWLYHHGELVDIRYDRTDPSTAQPVSIFKFWWTPGIYIVGGITVFLSLLLAFHMAENPNSKIITKFWKRKKRPLNLRQR